MGGMSLMHWIIVLVIILLLFGPTRLPGLGKSLGQAIRGFKKGLDSDSTESDEDTQEIAKLENTKADKTTPSTEQSKHGEKS